MSIVRYAGDRYTGTSSDTKPTTVLNGAEFIETDTNSVYFLKGGVWTALTIAGLSITSGKVLTVSNTLTLSGNDSATLNIGAGGTLGTGAFATIANYLPLAGGALTGTDPSITTDTSDSADSKRLLVGGGGSVSSSRGATIQLSGNEYGGYTGGSAIFDTGAVSGAFLKFRTNGSAETLFLKDGVIGVGTTSPGIYNSKLDVVVGSSSENVLAIRTSDVVQGTTGTLLYLGLGAATGNTYGEIRALGSGGNAVANLVLNPTGGSVGVGTIAPTYAKLQVGSITESTTASRIMLMNANAADINPVYSLAVYANREWAIGTESTGGGLVISKDPASYTTANLLSSTKVFISAIGNVGIGTAAPTSTFHNAGSLTTAYRAITGARTLDITDYFVDCTANTFSVTLPTAASITGRTYVIKNSGTGVITVICTGAETIDGNAIRTISSQYVSITVVSNGTNWLVC